jgi:alkyl hydroperoxide reductase subunit AhpC
MPNVVKAYAKFKNKGFEILGVSLDQDKDRWVEAIAKDGMTWPQVSDLKYWESAPARLYNVQSIPYTVLLDKEGKILDKNLRGEALEKRLEELLN